MRRRAILTGGAGFIGSHLAEQMLIRDMDVTCIDNFLTGRPENVAQLLDHPGFTLIEADVSNHISISGQHKDGLKAVYFLTFLTFLPFATLACL